MSRTYRNHKPQVIKTSNFLLTYEAYNQSSDTIQRRGVSSDLYVKDRFHDLPTKKTRYDDWIIWLPKKSKKKTTKPRVLDPVNKLVREHYINQQEDAEIAYLQQLEERYDYELRHLADWY